MKYGSLEAKNIRGPESEIDELRYSRFRVCHFCTLTKMIPEEDRICKDCWSLRMMGFALVACPYFQFEHVSLLYTDGKVPIEFCYDCAYRRGWTEELGPVCSHPVAVGVVETMGVKTVPCPERCSRGERAPEASTSDCETCPWYRGELTTAEGRFAYCSWPSARPISVDQREQDPRVRPRAFEQVCGSGR